MDKLLEIRGKSTRPETSFPIVGIGASAGGQEALELFLANVPPDSGMGFVIVKHLIPPNKYMSILNGLHLPVDLCIPLAWQNHSGKPNGNSILMKCNETSMRNFSHQPIANYPSNIQGRF